MNNMGIIKFFKEIMKELSKDKVKVKPETIKFLQISDWIRNKEEENKIKGKDITISIKEKLSLLIIELNEKLEFLKDVNLDKSKEPHRTKHIVLINLKEYVGLVKNLLNELENFNSLNLFKLNELVNAKFSNFNNRSHAKYKKATYLIGKELGDVNEAIQGFLRNYSNMIKENKELIDAPKIIHVVKGKLEDFEKTDKEIKKIEFDIKHIKVEIKKSKQKIKDYLDEIINVENSDAHLENLKNVKRKKEIESGLSKEIINLKQSIDFKNLAKIFHGSEKYRILVKSFKENFDDSFREDTGKNLISLLDESKLNNETITTKIKNINDKLQEIKNIKLKPEQNEIKLLEEKIKKIEHEIDNSNHRIDKELKRSQKIDDSKKDIKDSIKKELLKLNVEMYELKQSLNMNKI